MPIRVQNDLPVKEILEKENIFVMDEHRATHQDIRLIKIGLLNLMPLKEDTELQILRALSNSPLQVDVTFVRVTVMCQRIHQQVIFISSMKLLMISRIKGLTDLLSRAHL